MIFKNVYRAKGAAEFLYEVLREREGAEFVNISHTKLPTMAAHVRFVASKPFRYWYIITDAGTWCGYISATQRNEIGIVLLKAHQGKGIGSLAVKAFMRSHKPLRAIPSDRSGCWLANINPNNRRSVRMFTGLGFTLKQVTYVK